MPAPRFVLDDFWPSDLFLGGIPGAWYDPTDLSTMFQDSAGTTPVTAVEQPVGLILDKSQGLTQGSQLVVNGDGTTLTGWTVSVDPGCSATVSGGQFVLTTVAANGARLRQQVPVTAGKTYAISVFINANNDSGASSFVVWGAGYGAGTLASASQAVNGVFTAIVQATSANLYLQLNAYRAASGTVAYYDDVSVRELAGNHASQSTAASRPTYRARYNLLTFSEQFDNGIWARDVAGTGVLPVVTANAGVAPDGTTTADRIQFDRGTGAGSFSRIRQYAIPTPTGVCTWSVWMRTVSGLPETVNLRYEGTSVLCNVTGTWQRFSVSQAATFGECQIMSWTAAGGTQAPDVLVWGAQLLTAADVTATGNAYQRIAAATVYDTAPIFRPYLAFDGVDDGLRTSAINFTSTNKLTIFYGVTKNTDTVSVISELSADLNSNAGSFICISGTNNVTGFEFTSIGSAIPPGLGQTGRFTVSAPATSTITCIGDIAAPLARIRSNTVNGVDGTGNQGVGNYGNYALFIGARNGGASLRFNGRVYEYIIRGAASSVTEIADTELWVNARTGAY